MYKNSEFNGKYKSYQKRNAGRDGRFERVVINRADESKNWRLQDSKVKSICENEHVPEPIVLSRIEMLPPELIYYILNFIDDKETIVCAAIAIPNAMYFASKHLCDFSRKIGSYFEIPRFLWKYISSVKIQHLIPLLSLYDIKKVILYCANIPNYESLVNGTSGRNRIHECSGGVEAHGCIECNGGIGYNISAENSKVFKKAIYYLVETYYRKDDIYKLGFQKLSNLFNTINNRWIDEIVDNLLCDTYCVSPIRDILDLSLENKTLLLRNISRDTNNIFKKVYDFDYLPIVQRALEHNNKIIITIVMENIWKARFGTICINDIIMSKYGAEFIYGGNGGYSVNVLTTIAEFIIINQSKIMKSTAKLYLESLINRIGFMKTITPLLNYLIRLCIIANSNEFGGNYSNTKTCDKENEYIELIQFFLELQGGRKDLSLLISTQFIIEDYYQYLLYKCDIYKFMDFDEVNKMILAIESPDKYVIDRYKLLIDNMNVTNEFDNINDKHILLDVYNIMKNKLTYCKSCTNCLEHIVIDPDTITNNVLQETIKGFFNTVIQHFNTMNIMKTKMIELSDMVRSDDRRVKLVGFSNYFEFLLKYPEFIKSHKMLYDTIIKKFIELEDNIKDDNLIEAYHLKDMIIKLREAIRIE